MSYSSIKFKNENNGTNYCMLVFTEKNKIQFDSIVVLVNL